jgi:acyl dehydratase
VIHGASSGDTFTTDAHELHLDEIRSFAQEFDPQPFHLDEAAARHSIFAGLAASGWHTAAITMRLLVMSGPRLAKGIVGAGVKLDWKSPTRPGDVLHVQSEVLEVTPSRSRPDRGTAVLRSNTINQHGDIVQTLTATLMVSRRPT